MSATNTDKKSSAELTIDQLGFYKDGRTSESSLKDDTDGGRHRQATNPGHGKGHGVDPGKQVATFDTISNESFYVPIDAYEGRHRYDPKF